VVADWFEPPEGRCPHCGAEEFRWTDVTATGRIGLLLSRVAATLLRRVTCVRLRCRRCRHVFEQPQLAPRTVVGYHACSRSFAADLLSGRKRVRDWELSQHDYEWLGEGIYFWEHAPGRAWQWARQHHPDNPAVVATEIRLGRCLDLGDTLFAPLLRETYERIMAEYQRDGRSLPQNTGGTDRLARRLDCLIINRFLKGVATGWASGDTESPPFQTIRCPFEEGEPAFPGGNIRLLSHIQIAVRDRSCISPRICLLPEGGGPR
jgi:hypothetical protein